MASRDFESRTARWFGQEISGSATVMQRSVLGAPYCEQSIGLRIEGSIQSVEDEDKPIDTRTVVPYSGHGLVLQSKAHSIRARVGGATEVGRAEVEKFLVHE